jgi:hypothetical protein
MARTRTAPNPRPAALEALAKAIADPAPKVLLGTKTVPGFFIGSGQAQKTAALFCEQQGWVVGTGQWVGRGRTKKELYRITPAGVHAVLSGSEPSVLLRGLQAGVGETASSMDGLAAKLAEIAAQLSPLRERLGALQGAVGKLAETFKPPDLDELARKLAAADGKAGSEAPEPEPPPLPEKALAAEAEDFVRRWERERRTYCPLPELYRHLQQYTPGFSIGAFHDLLRGLHKSSRVRLGSWSGPLDRLPEPELALFLSSKVMYDAHVPNHDR